MFYFQRVTGFQMEEDKVNIHNLLHKQFKLGVKATEAVDNDS
jgi:hypothetical protein